MDGSDSNDVVKRRLPPWMMGVASDEKGIVGDSGNDNENRDDDDDVAGCREEGQKVKNRGGRRRKQKLTVVAVQEQRDNFSDGLGLELEPGCEDASCSPPVKSRDDRKRKKRKLNLDSKEAPRITTKRKNRQIRANQGSEDAAAVTECCSEDEDCLTVEDLMIFANECVKGRHDNTNREDEFVVVNKTIVQSGNSIDIQENKRKSEVEEITSSTFPSSSCIQRENVNLNVSGDHHPNQDMLDLLLGPLLKKAQEKKLDLAIDMDAFNFEMKRYEEGKDMGGGAVGQEQVASIVTVNQKKKKKTSLKDQVAMFLD